MALLGKREEDPQAKEAARLAKLEEKFWESPYGQARAAKLAGDKYFQIEIALDVTQSASAITVAASTRRYSGRGKMIGHIEEEGWELLHAGFVYKETGQVSRDKFLTSGQQTTTTGITYGIYFFKATDSPPNKKEIWRDWAEEGHG